MPARRAEVQASLARLSGEAGDRVASIVRAASSADAAVAALLELCPVLVETYGSAAASMAADWYEAMRVQAGFTAGFTPVLADDPPIEQVEALARWGVSPMFGGAGPDAAAALLAGGVSRLVVGMHRETVSRSALADDAAVGWARHARASACDFCLRLATRGGAYTSKKAAAATQRGSRYHDACHCIAVPVFEGRAYRPAPYLAA